MGQSGNVTELKVLELREVVAHHEAARLLSEVWGHELMEAGLIRAFSHTGNYVAGAYLGSELVGVTVAFLTADGQLHSHVTGVRSGLRSHGIGRALKFHQRDWALERGIGTVTWTFDPLVRRNAHFNLHRLGAVVTEYLPDFYGSMDDELNLGSPSDRLYVVWDLKAGPSPVPTANPDAVVWLDRDGDVPGPVAIEPGTQVLIAVPEDIEALRTERPEVAELWRLAVRAAFTAAFAADLRVTGITLDGFYVLEGVGR
jgi:predicted GNAT superfamily acetyltransferase